MLIVLLLVLSLVCFIIAAYISETYHRLMAAGAALWVLTLLIAGTDKLRA